MRYILPAVAAAMLTASAAVAQVPANTPSQAAAPIAAAGKWRASKLVGVNVYNEQNEKVGAISEIIVDAGGRVDGAVIGVGGFLGIGERDILIPLSQLKFANEAGKTTTGQTSSNNREWFPDRAVVNATKDQLKSVPEFKY